MTAEELIKLLDHAVDLLEKSEKRQRKEFEEWRKNHSKGGKNDGRHLSD